VGERLLPASLSFGRDLEDNRGSVTLNTDITLMIGSMDFSRHRILLTNDDGIDAPGLRLLEDIVREFSDDVWVVAPNVEHSGASHSISMHNPIRMEQRSERHYAIVGTPTDCVLMASYEIMPDHPPTIVIAGINNGANLAEDVSYSGTIAAAMEGALLGMRSIALSQVRNLSGEAEWHTAAQYARPLIRALIGIADWPADSFININFPDATPDQVSGVRVTTQGQRPPGSFTIDPRIDARNRPYYWVKIDYTDGEKKRETDLNAIHENAVSVTPLQLDFTNHAWRGGLAAVIEDLDGV
jgi:5'-nucleotidase